MPRPSPRPPPSPAPRPVSPRSTPDDVTSDKGRPQLASSIDTAALSSIATLTGATREADELVEEEQSDSGLVEVGPDSSDEGSPSGSAEEDDGSESESDSDDDEPTLKYSRLLGGTAEILERDTASAIVVSTKFIVLGTHNGGVFVLDHAGLIYKRFRPHSAMINDLSIDLASEFVASASMDGKISILSLLTPEVSVFDLRRPLICVSLEPSFSKRSNSRQFVSGGMAGVLMLHEKGWLGNKETVLHDGEGPIWCVEWRGTLIAWANDAGIRIYDTATSQRITYISRSPDSPRADLFKCHLYWTSDSTLLIAWADFIKVAKIRERETKRLAGVVGGLELYGEVQAIFQVDCMISGIAPYANSYLILAYLTEEEEEGQGQEAAFQRKTAQRPELRIIDAEGNELSSDALSLRDYEKFQSRDYSLYPSPSPPTSHAHSNATAAFSEQTYFVISPKDIVVAQARDEEDHIGWLIEQRMYEDALAALEKVAKIGNGAQGSAGGAAGAFDVEEVGRKYLDWLVGEGQFEKAAATIPKILGSNAKLWEDWVFLFAEKGHMQTIIPFVPTHDPQLSRLVYEMILAHYLRHDQEALLRTIKIWPADIYDVAAVIVALQDQLERKPTEKILMESIAELHILSNQSGLALPYFLKLRRPGVFKLITDNNLFRDVKDQAVLLIQFDEDLQKLRKREGNVTDDSWVELEAKEEDGGRHGTAIKLLVDHTHSIPVPSVVAQLTLHPYYLYLYLDALFSLSPSLGSAYADLQVSLYSQFEPGKLMEFLRGSGFYSLEKAFKVCEKEDAVGEMVFLLGRMGDNKRAMGLIIERLGDVQRAIEFAKEQNDYDLWEDLLKYSETKPHFIRGLLENVGAEIDPIRLISRIKDGLEIPGLKLALIKILQDFNLQISLMEGCRTILYSDCRQLSLTLHRGQTAGILWTGETVCHRSQLSLYPHLSLTTGDAVPPTLPVAVRYLCGPHFFDASSVEDAPTSSTALIADELLSTGPSGGAAKGMRDKLRLVGELTRSKLVGRGCEICL